MITKIRPFVRIRGNIIELFSTIPVMNIAPASPPDGMLPLELAIFKKREGILKAWLAKFPNEMFQHQSLLKLDPPTPGLDVIGKINDELYKHFPDFNEEVSRPFKIPMKEENVLSISDVRPFVV